MSFGCYSVPPLILLTAYMCLTFHIYCHICPDNRFHTSRKHAKTQRWKILLSRSRSRSAAFSMEKWRLCGGGRDVGGECWQGWDQWPCRQGSQIRGMAASPEDISEWQIKRLSKHTEVCEERSTHTKRARGGKCMFTYCQLEASKSRQVLLRFFWFRALIFMPMLTVSAQSAHNCTLHVAFAYYCLYFFFLISTARSTSQKTLQWAPQ